MSSAARRLGAVIPAGWMSVAFLLPILYLLVISFRQRSPADLLGVGFTLGNYAAILGDPFFRSIILQTVAVGAAVTLACLVIGYPLAFFVSRLGPTWRRVCLTLLVFPLLMSNVIRAYGWIAILGRQGLVNAALVGTGLAERPMTLLYSPVSIVVALLTILLPYAVVSISNTLVALDRRYVEASGALGIGPVRTFLTVVWPMSAPGVASGLAIVWLLSLSAYVTISLIGGSRQKLLVSLVYDSAMAFNWPRAAALAFVLLGVGLLGVAAIMAALRPDRVRGPR